MRLARQQDRAAHAAGAGLGVKTHGTEETVDHCKDCCCARAWKALGITEYTGLSIPEHIELLRTQLEAELKRRQDESNE